MKNYGKIIFVVDDDDYIQESMKLILESEGYQVETASDGQMLSKHLEKITPDMIILDYRLPGENGTEIATHLKANILTKNIPLILVSSHDVASLAKKTGFTDFFEKPFDIETLVSTVQRHLPI
jgi:DNA-binding response OmpR family regulator